MIAIGSDHAGYKAKEEIKNYFSENKIEFKDVGTFSEESCDYPVIAKAVADSVSQKESEKGIIVCGSGIGVSIAANKINGVRAALCYEPKLAAMSRKHNDANVLCLGGRFTDTLTILKIVKSFLYTDFEGERHQRRVDQITDIENSQKIR